ncbi:MAG: hypothetical protein J6I53_11655 [Treponema sp.]|nr:hypothetical protein [Treponema sp.]
MKLSKTLRNTLISFLATSVTLISCSNEDDDYNYEPHNAVVNFMLGSNVLSYDTSFAYDDALLVGADNTVYSPALARFASALAFDCYDTVKVSLKTSAKNPTSAYDNTTLYSNFGFEDATYTELSASDYLSDRQDLTNAVFAHRKVTADGTVYQIFTIAVQGSSGKDQWLSNFDVGDYSDATTTKNYATLSATHSVAAAVKADSTVDTSAVQAESLANYTTLANSFSTEHKGFALAALRLNEKFKEYVTAHEVSGAKKVLLLTGHSRGAAIANILGKVYEGDSDWTSFSYGFATPRTTTASNATEYKTIFNIINSDDLVTELPLKNWGFTRYGTDKSASIEGSYKAQWKNKLPFVSDYISANGENTSYLNDVAKNREDLYASESGTFSLTFATEEEANATLAYLQKLGLGVKSYDPYSTFAVTAGSGDSEGKYILSASFRPQFFLNTMVMGIILSSVSTETATTFVTTMISGYTSSIHKIALGTMASKITGFAYSHAVPCYTILVENLK